MNNAKVVGGISQRAKKAQKSKPVFKPVLENPFTIAWPEIALNVQNSFLGCTVDLLECLRSYHIERGLHSRKSRRARRRQILREKEKEDPPTVGMKRKEPPSLDSSQSKKRRKLDVPSIEPPSEKDVEETTEEKAIILPSQPAILQHVTFGLTQVGKALEQHIATLRNGISKSTALIGDMSYPIAILACRWDINPPQLFSHIPNLVASSNTLATLYHQKFPGVQPIPEIKLVNLPKGAESSLSESIGLRRVSIVLLTNKFPIEDRMEELLRTVPRTATPWLIPTTNPVSLRPDFQPTHVKHLKTTMPVDMKAAKAERTEARKKAKRKRPL
ncbi:hypothetical protein FRC19_001763 [Serendipita sp. 401]|nr:hypothetical protein FRC19_001763 [Serendipita sp. 401]